AGLDVRAVRRDHLVADAEALRREDVGLLAVGVLDQREAGGAVRVVLDREDLRGHAGLGAPEVDRAVALLVPTAAEPRRDAAVVVAAGLRSLVREQALLGLALRDLAEVLGRHAASARG